MDSSADATEGRATVGAGQLHTPQEQRHDSFTDDHTKGRDAQRVAPVDTLSPPASPDQAVVRPFNSPATHPQTDGPLFPDNNSSNSNVPLFDSHIEPAEPSLRQVPPAPSHAYVRGTTIRLERTREAAHQYWLDRMAELDRMRAEQRAAGTLPFPQPSPAAVPRDNESDRQLQLLTRSAGVAKIRSPPKAAAKPKAARAAQSPPTRALTPEQEIAHVRRSRTPRTAHKKLEADFLDEAFPAENEKKHRRAAPSKQTASKEEDVHWRDLPDYAPPVETLDDPTKKFKVGWNQTTSAFRLEDEPDVDCLHPQELQLAKVLRLRPVQYLANKRRIFARKVSTLKEGKSFTKTTAQNVTNIDVNKASRLWEAFDNAGWLDKHWFEKYLSEE